MTKEEYMAKLEAQFGGEETLIPETPKVEEENTGSNTEETAENPKETQTVSESNTEENTQDVNSEDTAEKDTSEGDNEELTNPDNGKKFSNKKIKKTIWENKNLVKQVQELKRQLDEIRKANEPAPAKMKRPSKDQFSSEDEYQDAVFAYNMSLLAEQNKAHTEEQMEKARLFEQAQREFVEKVKENIPESKIQEFVAWANEDGQNLSSVLDKQAEKDILSMFTAPLILWKLGQSPDLISHVNKMNQVERIMFCNEIAKQMENELKMTETPKPTQKAPVIGKVGTGKAETKNVDDMTPEEMYNMMSKRLAGG